MNPEEPSASLLQSLGITPEYYDAWGNKHSAPAESIHALLRTLGIDDATSALDEISKKPWNVFIEPVCVVSAAAQPPLIPLHFPLAAGQESETYIYWRTVDEKGTVQSFHDGAITVAGETTIEGRRHVRVNLPNLTDRELGYYTIEVECRTPSLKLRGVSRLIVTPDRCHIPDRRTWGITASLYALRSERNWGVGDLTDLSGIMGLVGDRLKGGFVGINPLHAISNRLPYGISPYSSISRLYRNPIYIDMELALSICPGGRRVLRSKALKADLKQLRSTEMVDYDRVFELKMRYLKAAFIHFRKKKNSPEYAEFTRYVDREGHELENYALFMALTEFLRRQSPEIYSWRMWPAKYLHPKAPGIREFRQRHPVRIKFHKFVQWLIERQLAGASVSVPAMPIGIYNDLAVGSSGEGSDAWSFQEVFATGMSAGAPPDDFNVNGQSWGFPPLLPSKLRESGYELFIQTIRKNLAHAGALRIDHAIGLFRIFCVPEGMKPKDGLYLRYPSEDLLRIIALESVRARAAIIAEDLGAVSDDIREALTRYGMLSYRLFYFERNWDEGTFLPPESYPALALAAISTHDLPTLSGYLAGRDIEVKTDLGIYPDETARGRDLEERARVRQAMIGAVIKHLPDGFDMAHPQMQQALCRAIYAHLDSTPCLMVSVSIEDILGVIEQQNMPGTVDEHPNWQRKIPMDIEELGRSDDMLALYEIFRQRTGDR